jgi:basic membrane protein A and related proteins
MKIRLGIACFIFILGIGGCDRQAAAAGGAAPRAARNAFSVAIVLPRSLEADAWTRSGYLGLLAIKNELGASIAYSENVPESEFENVFRQYAARSFDFVIGHGAQFIPAAGKAAAEFPRTSFAVDGVYGGNNTNLGGIAMREGEMAYLFGALAAIKTKTKHVAYLGGAENPSSREIVTLFKRGARKTDPEIQITLSWVGNFTDSGKAQTLAQTLIEAGVDIIFVLAGEAGTGVHAQAQKSGIYTLGWTEDLNYLAPKAVLASSVQDIPAMLVRAASLVKQGRWEGKQYRFGMAEGTQYLAPFHGLLSEEEERRINAVKNDILTGKIDIAP